MHTVDILPVVFVGSIFLYIAYKVVSEYISARRVI